jgi:hypothetical protein
VADVREGKDVVVVAMMVVEVVVLIFVEVPKANVRMCEMGLVNGVGRWGVWASVRDSKWGDGVRMLLLSTTNSAGR